MTSVAVPAVRHLSIADQELVLKAELPDISSEDIEINISNDTLTISGESGFPTKSKKIKSTAVSGSPAPSAGRSRSLHQSMRRRFPRSTRWRPHSAAACARGSQAAPNQG